jgi:hypothetical protein
MPKKKEKNTFTCTLMFTEQQHDELMKFGKAMSANDITDFINRCIVLGKIVGNSLINGGDILAINTDQIQILEQKDNKQVAILGKTNDIKFVTDEIKDVIEFAEDIKETNGWGMPIDPIKC